MAKKQVVKPQQGQGIPAVVDPNPGRTAADIAEANVTNGATGDAALLAAMTGDSASVAAANKDLNEQAHADQVQDTAQDTIDEHEASEEAADIAFETMESDMEVINRIMADHNVTELFENSKQEYFLTRNMAELSEGGNKNRVKTHTALTE